MPLVLFKNRISARHAHHLLVMQQPSAGASSSLTETLDEAYTHLMTLKECLQGNQRIRNKKATIARSFSSIYPKKNAGPAWNNALGPSSAVLCDSRLKYRTSVTIFWIFSHGVQLSPLRDLLKLSLCFRPCSILLSTGKELDSSLPATSSVTCILSTAHNVSHKLGRSLS